MLLSPLGPIASAYYLDNSEVAVIEGPVGSAKTTASCLRLHRHALAQTPSLDGWGRTRFAVVRQTKPQLKDTTMVTWKRVFPENEYGVIEAMAQTWKFHPEGHPWPIEAEFIFRALDDPDDVANLLSLEVTGFYMNEVREADETIIGHLRQRCRYLNSERAAVWRGWIGDTNSWDMDHWLEDRLATHPRAGWKHFRQPGGMDPNAENLENLEQTEETLKLPFNDPRRRERGRVYYTKALEDYSTDEARVYVHAERAPLKSGKPIYTEFRDRTHISTFELDPRIPLRIGYDFGRTPAAVIGQRTTLGRYLIRHELCGVDIGIKAHAEELKRFLAEKFPQGYEVELLTGDPAGETKEGDEETAFTRLKAAGFEMAAPASTNELSLRIETVQNAFRLMREGDPMLVIHPECKMLRRACIDGYHYRKLQVAGNRYSDQPNKNAWSHPGEALQYFLLGSGEGRVVVRRHHGARRQRIVITEYNELG